MKTYILGLGLCLCMTSCLNDGFLDIDPKDRQTEQTAFTSYDNFKMYSWGLYEIFYGSLIPQHYYKIFFLST